MKQVWNVSAAWIYSFWHIYGYSTHAPPLLCSALCQGGKCEDLQVLFMRGTILILLNLHIRGKFPRYHEWRTDSFLSFLKNGRAKCLSLNTRRLKQLPGEHTGSLLLLGMLRIWTFYRHRTRISLSCLHSQLHRPKSPPRHPELKSLGHISPVRLSIIQSASAPTPTVQPRIRPWHSSLNITILPCAGAGNLNA